MIDLKLTTDKRPNFERQSSFFDSVACAMPLFDCSCGLGTRQQIKGQRRRYTTKIVEISLKLWQGNAICNGKFYISFPSMCEAFDLKDVIKNSHNKINRFSHILNSSSIISAGKRDKAFLPHYISDKWVDGILPIFHHHYTQRTDVSEHCLNV